eukprot:scaffold15279_cov37-Attheya_sp.AAC.5
MHPSRFRARPTRLYSTCSPLLASLRPCHVCPFHHVGSPHIVQLFRAPYSRAYPIVPSLPNHDVPHLPEPISRDVPTRAYTVPRLPEPIP